MCVCEIEAPSVGVSIITNIRGPYSYCNIAIVADTSNRRQNDIGNYFGLHIVGLRLSQVVGRLLAH